MKKILTLFIAAVATNIGAADAVSIKKAAPVATQSASGAETAGSLVPAVLNLVSGIQQINAQQQALTAECIPTSQEITFVNDTMKEWAKTGASSAEDMRKALNRTPCASSNGGYQLSVEIAAGTDDGLICYETFSGTGNDNMVWAGFPRVSKATYCSDGSLSCSESAKKTASDIYEIFNLIDFTEQDYTASEATMAAKLLNKIEKCSPAKLSARKRVAWGDFLMQTVSGVGQKTNTGDIMQAVGALGSGGTSGMLQSLGAMATQFVDR